RRDDRGGRGRVRRRAGRRGRGRGPGRRRGHDVNAFGKRARSVSVLTHARSEQSTDALACLLAVARELDVELWFTEDEARKHGLSSGPGLRVAPDWRSDADLCVALGGDGTILMGLRQQIGTGVPVFAVNLG